MLADWLFGMTHETAGKRPRRAAAKNFLIGSTFRSSWSRRTVSNHGSGFQIPGVFALCRTGLQTIASSSQSGCAPGEDVVAPGDVALVQQIGEIGPRVVRLRARRVLRPRAAGRAGFSTAFTQLIGSPRLWHRADHSETMNR